jgi:hypothetical protein
MILSGLTNEDGQKVDLIISDEGKPYYHVLMVEVHKPLPKTKDEIYEFLDEWNAFNGTWEDFIKDYE